MDIFLDDKTTLQLMRTLTRDHTSVLVPSDVRQPARVGLGTVKLYRLGIEQLLVKMRIPEISPLGLLVPTLSDRIHVRGIDCHVLSSARGAVPFLQLVSANEHTPGLLVPPKTRVFALSAPMVVLGMARRLRQQVLNRRMGHRRALLMLVKLCLELCGTYSHDPLNPRMGSVAYATKPWLDAHALATFCEPPGREQGLALLREALPLVYDLSGSPQESFMGPALFFDDSLGGLGLCDFAANKPLELSAAQREAIDGRVITPDFTLQRYNSVVEYLGSIHERGNNPRIDHVRTLDYETLGVREFAFTYEDVRDRGTFMHSARRIATALSQISGPEVQRRFDRLATNEAFAGRQQELFEVFRPWLR